MQFIDAGEKAPETRIKLNDNRGFKFDKVLHKYLLDGVELISGTTIVSRYKKPFENAMVSNLVASKNEREGRQYLLTAEQVRKYWKTNGERASNIGTAGHAFCEMFYMDSINTVAQSKLEDNATSLMKAIMHKYNILEMEVNRGNKTHMIGYTIDIVLQHKLNGAIILGDFKFAKTFTPEQYAEQHNNKKPGYLLSPFKELNMRDCAFHLGELQMNLYKALYEEDTGLKVDGMLLFHVDGALKDNWYERGFQSYQVRDLSEQVKAMLEPMKKSMNILDVAKF